MALQEKFKSIIDAATAAGVSGLKIREQDGVLYIDGTAYTGKIKDELWEAYQQIDPEFKGGDLIMDIKVSMDANVSKVKVVTEKSNLNIRKGPGTDQPVVGKASHGEIITLISRTNDEWWLVRTDAGEEGYAYALYLSAEL